MSEEKDQEAYWSLVEELLELANGRAESLDLGLVSSALLQASARYNAFHIASSSVDRKSLKVDRDDSIKEFGAEYKRHLSDHLDDYIENYKIYIAREESDDTP